MQSHTPDCAQIGSRTGLFDFHVNQDINVFVGCGLGGTSLVNANVALRAEPRVFDDPRWPHELRNPAPVDQNVEMATHATALEDGYQRAEEMLKPNPYPTTEPDASQARSPAKVRRADGQEILPAAHQCQLYRQRAQPRGRGATALHGLWRLRQRLQLRGEKHADHELPARRRESWRQDFYRSLRPLD